MDQEIGKIPLLAIKNDTLPPTENLICRQYIALSRHTSLALHSFCWVFQCMQKTLCDAHTNQQETFHVAPVPLD